MPRIDLHTHSTASDGADAPATVMAGAAAAGLTTVALTDHDTTAGWDEAAGALPAGLALVRGIEISCRDSGVSLHLLAYLPDAAHPPLVTALQGIRDGRHTRADRMVELLMADGWPVTVAGVRAVAGAGTIGRPHVAQALVDAGVVPDVGAAFTPEWLADGGRYFVGKDELDAVGAIRLVRAAGGVPVFAHPFATKRGRTVGVAVIERFAEAGLAGLEADHVDHDADQAAALRRIAADLGLLVTGSSDFHGARKTVRLGDRTTSPAVLEAIVAQAGPATPVLSA